MPSFALSSQRPCVFTLPAPAGPLACRRIAVYAPFPTAPEAPALSLSSLVRLHPSLPTLLELRLLLWR